MQHQHHADHLHHEQNSKCEWHKHQDKEPNLTLHEDSKGNDPRSRQQLPAPTFRARQDSHGLPLTPLLRGDVGSPRPPSLGGSNPCATPSCPTTPGASSTTLQLPPWTPWLGSSPLLPKLGRSITAPPDAGVLQMFLPGLQGAKGHPGSISQWSIHGPPPHLLIHGPPGPPPPLPHPREVVMPNFHPCSCQTRPYHPRNSTTDEGAAMAKPRTREGPPI